MWCDRCCGNSSHARRCRSIYSYWVVSKLSILQNRHSSKFTANLLSWLLLSICSEEINLATENLKEQTIHLSNKQQFALTARGHGFGAREWLNFRNSNRGRNGNAASSNPRQQISQGNPNKGKLNQSAIQCQICEKFGQSVVKCYYRLDQLYKSNPNALLAANTSRNSKRILNSGATSHLTNDSTPLTNN